MLKDQKEQDVNNGTTTASASTALADELVAAKDDVKDELPVEQLQTVHDQQPPAYPDLIVSEYFAGPKGVFGRVAVANPAIHRAYQDSFMECR